MSRLDWFKTYIKGEYAKKCVSGKVVSGWRVRDKNNWKLIGKKDPMLPQMFYPIETEMTVRKGDTIAARCTMVNNRDRLVYLQGSQACTTQLLPYLLVHLTVQQWWSDIVGETGEYGINIKLNKRTGYRYIKV